MTETLSRPPVRPDGLQLDEHRQFQERFWKLQRIAWVGFILIILCAMLGFTGSGGYLQKQTIQFQNAIVELPRVSRWEGSDEMSVTFLRPAESHELFLGDQFFERFSVEQIRPAAESNALSSLGHIMRFSAEGAPSYRVWFDLRPKHFGLTGFDIKIGSETRRVNVLILP